MSEEEYILKQWPHFEQVLKKLKKQKPDLLKELDKGIEKLLRDPSLGKPLRKTLRNQRRLHIAGSFVLLYELRTHEIWLLDFDHHDKVYKKF